MRLPRTHAHEAADEVKLLSSIERQELGRMNLWNTGSRTNTYLKASGVTTLTAAWLTF
jgi:hypothetical protein